MLHTPPKIGKIGLDPPPKKFTVGLDHPKKLNICFDLLPKSAQFGMIISKQITDQTTNYISVFHTFDIKIVLIVGVCSPWLKFPLPELQMLKAK